MRSTPRMAIETNTQLSIGTVLVVEYGEIEYAPGVSRPPQTSGMQSGGMASTWNLQSLPSPDVKNKTASVIVGKVVGGSSAVNGMYFDRGSRFDYDAWAQAGSPDFNGSQHNWDWSGIFPYFKKVSSLFHNAEI